MRKNKFITGTVALGLVAIIGCSSIAQIGGPVSNDTTLCCEAESAIVTKPASDILTVVEPKTNSTLLESAPVVETETITLDIQQNTDEELESNDLKENETTKAKKKKNKNKKLEYMGNYKVTAYCGCVSCCGKSNCITASGTKCKEGRTIAADTSVLPFGTKVVIDGHTYTVEDRGGAIDGNRIDVYFDSHQDALNWGVKYIDVYVKK